MPQVSFYRLPSEFESFKLGHHIAESTTESYSMDLIKTDVTLIYGDIWAFEHAQEATIFSLILG